MKKTMAMAWMLGMALAWGEEPMVPPQWTVQFETGNVLTTSYAPAPIRIQTATGNLTFVPEELERIEFPMVNQCVVATVYGDRWLTPGEPKLLAKMVEHSGLWESWDTVKSVVFPAATGAVAESTATWTVELQNGSRAGLVLEEAPLRIDTDTGRYDIPPALAASVRVAVSNRKATGWVELAPGGYALRGNLAGSPPRGQDQGGRKISVPWTGVARLQRVGHASTEEASLVFEQPVSIRRADGSEIKGALPVAIMAIQGGGGTWVLPTTRIRRMSKNSNGSFSVQTTVGEWLTGTIEPGRLPLSVDGVSTPVAFADCLAVEWSNETASMPEKTLSWRLKSGDILVGEWMDEAPAASSSSSVGLRVRGASGETDVRAPQTVEGKWPQAQYEVRHWASGLAYSIPATALEAVRAASPERLPPALPPFGASAMRSDEVRVDGGAFQMGRLQGEGGADEVPPVDLQIEPFWMAATPVTVAQFGAFAAATRHVTDAERVSGSATWRAPGFLQRPDDPVVCVSWRDAVRYCNWLSASAGLAPCYEDRAKGGDFAFLPAANGYRLPLEAEWEFAARSGGQPKTFPWGEEQEESAVAGLANFRLADAAADAWPWTSPVKTFPSTGNGLYDMAGNVWQWCQDVYREDSYLRLAHGEGMERLLNAEAGVDARRAMRGGSYLNPVSLLRCAARGFGVERMSAPRVGFRVVRNAEDAR